MATRNFTYRLSQAADQDIEAIFDYTQAEYGLQQAIQYTSSFSKIFDELVTSPELGRNRPEIRIGLRSIAHQEHVIFYRIMKDHIRIVRVLYGRSDIPRFLDKS